MSSRGGMYLIAIVICSLLMTSSYHSQSYQTNELPTNLFQDSPVVDFTNSLEYILVESMRIESDEDFILLGIPGSGTTMDPYRIEYFKLGGSGIDTALFISNITKHFIIENCRIAATFLINIANIPDVRFNITDNSIYNTGSYYPIDTRTGIKLINCCNVSITGNIVESSYIGLEMISTNNIHVMNNSFSGNDNEDSNIKYAGIRLKNTMGCKFINNLFSKGGFSLDLDFEQFNDLLIENNSIREREILFSKNETGTIVSNNIYGQILLFNCQYIIVNNLILSELYIGIGIFFSDSCEVYDNMLIDCHQGIYDFNSYNSIISNNFCDKNSIGISVETAENCILKNNTCINSNFYDGIQLSNSLYSLVENNNCSFNRLGNGIFDSSFDSLILNNVCEFNGYGLHMWFSEATAICNNKFNQNSGGIWVLDANDIGIYNNSVEYNTKFGGIIVQNGIGGTLSYNLLLENVGYGVTLNGGTKDYIVHHNSFFNNLIPSDALSQASDDGIGNCWYHPDTLVGNYWSDRGISSKYEIDGTAESIDSYPLKEPIVLPSTDYTGRSTFFIALTLTALAIVAFVHRKKRGKI